MEDGFCPSGRLRLIELQANEVFDIYRELYFGKSTSVSSVYLWNKEEGESVEEATSGFAGSFLIHNKVDDGSYWNSIHVVDVGNVQEGKCHYKLTSTILISITPPSEVVKSTTITGSLVRQNARECKISSQDSTSSQHIINIGRFIEDVETEMRKEMDSLYIRKTQTIVDMIRKDTLKPTQGQEHTRVLNEAVLAMAMNRKAKVSEK
jgi:capping protein beta